jgi:hypothetical protein
VQRIGVRGIRGIEWRSNGFTRSTITPASASDTSSAQQHEEEGSADGLVLKVNHMYLDFHPKDRKARYLERRDRANSVDARISGQQGEKEVFMPASKAWITLRIEGVGVSVPKSRQEEEDEQEKSDRLEKERKETEDAERRVQEAEEERLNFLMQSRPSSPMLGAAPDRPSRSNSPMPALSAAMDQIAAISPPHDDTRTTDQPRVPSKPLQYALKSLRPIRQVVLPAIWLSLLNWLRMLLYFFISALPFLTSLIDIEVTRVEVYSIEAEAVVRIETVGLDLGMFLIPSNQQQQQQQQQDPEASCAQTNACKSYARWVSDTIVSMPNRIGSGAKGAASVITDGLPGSRVSLRLTTQGLQVFEATIARRPQPSASFPSDRKVDIATNYLKPSSLDSPLSRLSGEEPEWSSFSMSSNITPATSIKRSRSFTSFSRLVPGHFGRGKWADWALEPLSAADDAPQTGWRRKADTGSKADVIQPSARLLSMPGMSSLKLGVVLSGTSGISSKESLHLGLELSEAVVGADALLKVLSTLEQRKAMRNGPFPTAEGKQG